MNMKWKFLKPIKTVPSSCLVVIALFGLVTNTFAAPADSITAAPMQYHKVTLDWEGPIALTESSATFNNYRLNVTFTSPSGQTFLVPGYFAADGNAAESSAVAGNIWRVHINPQEIGEWSYAASFRTGNGIAISLAQNAGTAVVNSFNGSTGSFTVTRTNKSGIDFRGKGKLQYVGEHFLQFSNRQYFLKVAANSPEVFLQYEDFDNTDSNRNYEMHRDDWNPLDPDWQNGKGREIIGVVNYLSEIGINENYFLTMNIDGDGREAFPFIADDQPNIYDVSKLAQWQIVFDHMMKKGVMTHFVTTETENESWFEYNANPGAGITFADTRKLYYRELVARFGYLNAITWNIGEENGWGNVNDSNVGEALTTQQRIAFAKYLDDVNPYEDLIVIHNNPSVRIHEDLYIDGATSYNGASFQIGLNQDDAIRRRLKNLISGSASTTPPRKWVVAFDEPFTGQRFPDVAEFRENAIWNTFMLGGAGVGLYIGGGGDINEQDYREFSAYWLALDHAYDFFIDNNIPFWRMQDADDLTSRGFALAEEGRVYVVYLPDGGTPNVDLAGSGSYDVFWYNPRTGGALQAGSIAKVNADNSVSLGNPPSSLSSEWVVVAREESLNNPIDSEDQTCSPIKTQNGSIAIICL